MNARKKKRKFPLQSLEWLLGIFSIFVQNTMSSLLLKYY